MDTHANCSAVSNRFSRSYPFIVLLFLAGCQTDRKIEAKISILVKRDSLLQLNIDALKKTIDTLRRQLKKSSAPQIGNILSIPFFINQTSAQVKSYWETKVSFQYIDEGNYTGTNDKYFTVMFEKIGTPEFTANFDNRGFCESHDTKISYSDISIMQAKLKNAGYEYQQQCKCWKLPGQKHSWAINEYPGNIFLLECRRN